MLNKTRTCGKENAKMKRKFALLAIISSAVFAIPVFPKTDSEILFRNIPWGSTYESLKQTIPELDWYTQSFDSMKHYPYDEVLTDDYDYNEIHFEYGGINMIARPFSNDEIPVAGYTTSNVECYFAYTDDGSGTLPKDDLHTSLYGARYEFEPQDAYIMYDDLKSKLSTVYGEPDDIKKRTSMTNTKYEDTFWYGANNTAVRLHLEDNSQNEYFDDLDDSVYISYAWGEADNLLHSADNVMKAEAQRNEAAGYGSGNTDGL